MLPFQQSKLMNTHHRESIYEQLVSILTGYSMALLHNVFSCFIESSQTEIWSCKWVNVSDSIYWFRQRTWPTATARRWLSIPSRRSCQKLTKTRHWKNGKTFYFILQDVVNSGTSERCNAILFSNVNFVLRDTENDEKIKEFFKTFWKNEWHLMSLFHIFQFLSSPRFRETPLHETWTKFVDSKFITFVDSEYLKFSMQKCKILALNYGNIWFKMTSFMDQL